MSDSNQTISRSKRIVFQLIALFFGLLIISLIGEVIFRVFPQFAKDPSAVPPHNYRLPNDLLGWVVKEDYQYKGEMRDFKGNPYPLHITFGKSGFRKWGNPASSQKKVLFIGDSYTACAQTSDDKTFYKILGDSLPIEVFAYGAAGYGSTQEYLITEQYLQEIKPDLVVWEMCSNDFIDNYWELEKVADYKVQRPRPYTLEDGSITRQFTVEKPQMKEPYSHFLFFISQRIGAIWKKFHKSGVPSAEQFIAAQNLNYEPFARSVKMTDVVYKKMKALLGPNIKLLVFDADSFNPQYDQFVRLSAENNIPFAAGLDAFVRQAEVAGECTRSEDGYHWNDLGNELVATFLKKEVERRLQEK